LCLRRNGAAPQHKAVTRRRKRRIPTRIFAIAHYNSSMRLVPVLFVAVLAGTGVYAQTPPAPAAPPAPLTAQEQQKADRAEGKSNQKVELIHLEDSANVIDEVRFGGQTQSITVQPKNSRMPEYEIQPQDLSRTRPSDNRDGSNNAPGKSLWNVHKF
jgi:hypothetical protein